MSDHKELTHPIHGAHSVPDGVDRMIAQLDEARRERDAELATAKEQLAAQLSELNSISDALGTNEGHSSVDHILALRGQLAAAKADLHNAKKSLARYQEVLDQNSDLKEQLAAAKERAEDAERDAKRWQAVPAFLQKYQIDYVGLLRDVDEFNEVKNG